MPFWKPGQSESWHFGAVLPQDDKVDTISTISLLPLEPMSNFREMCSTSHAGLVGLFDQESSFVSTGRMQGVLCETADPGTSLGWLTTDSIKL